MQSIASSQPRSARLTACPRDIHPTSLAVLAPPSIFMRRNWAHGPIRGSSSGMRLMPEGGSTSSGYAVSPIVGCWGEQDSIMTADLPAPIRRILVANRSEIAIRVFRAASELGLATVAIYAEEDKLSLHRFKADEAYRVGRGVAGELQLGPLESYLSIAEVIRVAVAANVDAIHPGYGSLSESPEFAEACAANGIVFIGPRPETMRTLGTKVSAHNLAQSMD